MHAIILRGVPGSGKTTLAKELVRRNGKVGIIHSTDDYFLADGEYRFEPNRLAENHAKNLAAFKRSLAKRVPLVICDNTNIKRSHFSAYQNAAKEMGYSVTVLNLPHPDPETAAKRNVHGVPAQVIQKKIEEWED